ncbi:putative NAD(P)/FAD-binding protein YdhS [Kitasatospora sp. MAP12-15]|uniref:FAD/NAD(P)-binding protein n=1 Tax=unclassified Kitasatospora TaxID=2633591 RepID=UPI002475624A|nr:FAD/NAD(P)-binding protein [Kitasatospora sp. MAP12-44]MDH6114835.1 putative NAD(P)/FAD-binding protein YdhS [Kitasatospora sp. MAP12-44]
MTRSQQADQAYQVAVVGAGASGTLAAARLLQHARTRQLRLDVRLIDPAEAGRGVAYGTQDPRHLLNVPACKMSAYGEDPGHFLRWASTQQDTAPDPGEFLPRRLYHRYLVDVLARAAEPGAGVRLHHLRERVLGLSAHPDRVALRLRPKAEEPAAEELHADAVVLALGNFPPTLGWAPPELLESPHFVADPWAPGALSAVPADADVLLVGTGLTMVDAALTLDRPGRVVYAVSRNGLLPEPHAAGLLPELAPPVLDESADPRAAALRQIATSRRLHGDWRPGVDSLRSVTAALWQRLDLAERARFLAEDLRHWEVHRHRIPPRTVSALDSARADGRLRIGRGEVAQVVETAAGLKVQLVDGSILEVGAVINCTGSQADFRRSIDPLVDALIESGAARPGPCGLGLDTTGAGLLVPGSGSAPSPLWTLGPLRRGNLLETTAMPEIRDQADSLADALLAALVR